MKKVLSLGLLFISFFLHAQNFGNFGGHPSNVHWQQIDSKNVRVIFPENLDYLANRIAQIIEHMKDHNTYSIGEKSKKIDVVLHTHRVISNGFVSLAPYRSEFFGTGLQNFQRLGAQDWLDGLAIHEYRHALQFSNTNRGITKLFHIIGGQRGWGASMLMSVPNWYFEGDATLTETFLSQSGRGRTPSFFQEQRALLLNDKIYHYQVARNGSFQKLVPNHYRLGYVLCNYTRNTYGADKWANIIADAGKFYSFYPFSTAMKRYTGKKTYQMYKEAYHGLKLHWENELDSISIIQNQKITSTPKTITNYKFPQLLDNGSIIAIKNSYQKINSLVQIKNGKEEKLTSYGITPDVYLSENSGVLSWAELELNPRRSNQSYTKIITYNIRTHQKKEIIKKSKYFSPHISSKGEKLIVVKADEHLSNQLLIIDSKNGKTLGSIPNSCNDFLSFPKWTKDDKAIVFIAKREGKIALMKHDLIHQKTSLLTNWSHHVIGGYDLTKDHVYFSGSYSGIDNIYAVNLNGNKQIKQISSVKVGAYMPSISDDGKELVMSEFTDKGYALTKTYLNLTPDKKTIEYVEPYQQKRFQVNLNEKEHNILDKIPNNKLDVKPYKGFFKSTQLHSWGVTVFGDSPGLNVSFANSLNDLIANVGGVYNRNEESFQFLSNIKYGKYFTEIGLRGTVLDRSTFFLKDNRLTTESFDEYTFGADVSVPLSWIKGNYAISLLPEISYTFHQTNNYENSLENRSNLSFSTLGSEISFSFLRETALQNLQPKYGVILSAQYQTSVSDVSANKFFTSNTFYLPGLLNNHGIRLNYSWQKEGQLNIHQFSDLFFYSRGYSDLPNDEVSKLSVNYTLPLLYPDLGLWGVTYFKRIRANVFFDLSNAKLLDTNYGMNSYGGELIFDNTFFNLIPLSIGLRQSFLQNTHMFNNTSQRFQIFLSLGVNLN